MILGSCFNPLTHNRQKSGVQNAKPKTQTPENWLSYACLYINSLTIKSIRPTEKLFVYRTGSFFHRINISRMAIFLNIRDFIFANPLASWLFQV